MHQEQRLYWLWIYLRRGEEKRKLSKGVEKKGRIYREESSLRELSTAVEIPLKGP